MILETFKSIITVGLTDLKKSIDEVFIRQSIFFQIKLNFLRQIMLRNLSSDTRSNTKGIYLINLPILIGIMGGSVIISFFVIYSIMCLRYNIDQQN